MPSQVQLQQKKNITPGIAKAIGKNGIEMLAGALNKCKCRGTIQKLENWNFAYYLKKYTQETAKTTEAWRYSVFFQAILTNSREVAVENNRGQLSEQKVALVVDALHRTIYQQRNR